MRDCGAIFFQNISNVNSPDFIARYDHNQPQRLHTPTKPTTDEIITNLKCVANALITPNKNTTLYINRHRFEPF